MSREGRAQPIQPYVTHGFAEPVVVTDTPPPSIVVAPDDRRRRQHNLGDAVFASVPLAALPAPTVDTPPEPISLDRPEQRHRYRTPEPFVGISAQQAVTP